MKQTLLPLIFVLVVLGSPTQAQHYNDRINVQHYEFSLRLNDANNVIRGEATITLQLLKDTSSFLLDLVKKNSSGKGMLVSSVTEGGKTLRFRQNSETLEIFPAGSTSGSSSTSGGAASGGDVVTVAGALSGPLHTYTITYEGIPADGLIIGPNKYGHRGFFGDNWPNRAHNWLPCVDHPSDKASVDFIITAPDHYEVVANGRKEEEKALPDHYKMTHWKELAPLSPKVMVIGVADFAIDHPGDVQGIPIYNYVFPENKEQGFRSYAIATEILPFYIGKIGPYPFEKEGNVQSKTRFGGLENASAIFYFENSVSSPGVESLMAHEIAHQWFGDAVTETDWKHLWLSEGFATYMTHCYLENKYGPDTLQRGMAKDRAKLLAYEKKRLTPIVDTTVKSDYMQLLNPNSYEKGGWVLHMLRRRLGDKVFWKGIGTYYATYHNRNANSSDFEGIMEAASGQDLHAFFHQWLDQAGHPAVSITWKYDAAKKEVVVDFVQTGGSSKYEFPLEYTVDGALHTVELHEGSTRVQLPFADKPATVIPDPNVNMLATFEVKGM